MTQSKKNNILDYLKTLKYMGFKYTTMPTISKTTIPTNKQLPNSSNSLDDTILNCNLCDFSKSRSCVLVGVGNTKANVMFVGLAPSNLDDENKNLLSGNIGKMFEDIAKHILKIDIKDIYVTNLLKCLPTSLDNITNELESCMPYFQKQIDLIKPKVIVAFGDTILHLIDTTQNLSQLRGIVQDYNGIDLIATYHPSFLLRNPSFKKDTMEDMQKVKNILDTL